MSPLDQVDFDAIVEADVAEMRAAQQERDELAYREWEAICERRAWGDYTKVLQLEGFVRERGLLPEFVEYARLAAEIDERAMDGGQPQLVEKPHH